MTDAHRALLRMSVQGHEGLRLKPYRDTVGKLTIGYGRNLDDVGISETEAALLLARDLDTAESACVQAFPWFHGLDGVRQTVIVEMAFNLGLTRLLGFVNTLRAVSEHRFEAAAAGMLKSKWAQQVGRRARTLARRMRTGEP